VIQRELLGLLYLDFDRGRAGSRKSATCQLGHSIQVQQAYSVDGSSKLFRRLVAYIHYQLERGCFRPLPISFVDENKRITDRSEFGELTNNAVQYSRWDYSRFVD
jgi:hypothetical protein